MVFFDCWRFLVFGIGWGEFAGLDELGNEAFELAPISKVLFDMKQLDLSSPSFLHWVSFGDGPTSFGGELAPSPKDNPG